MSGDFVPETTQQKAPDVRPTYELPARKDYRLERELQQQTQRALLEKLRHKQYERAGTLGRFLQRLGDFGRTWFPFIGKGWDGLGGRRTE